MENSDLEKFDDDVDRYFKGQMSDSEERAFLAMAEADPELKSRLTVIALMKKSMHDIRLDETKHIDAEIRNMGEEEFSKRTGSLHQRKSRLWNKQYFKYALAACIIGIVAVGVWIIMQPNPYKALGNSCDYYAYNTDIEQWSLRGDEDIASEDIDVFSNLFANVAEGANLDSTIALLEKAYVENLKKDSELTDAIAWNLAIAYLKDGNGEKARAILEEMRQRNSGLYPETEATVKALIDQIDHISR